MTINRLSIALALGSICALGPFATDMHVSALPAMARDLMSSDATMQLSMTTYFVGFTLGQLFYGPVSDRTGRKPMIYLALAIFVAASIGCVFSSNAQEMLILRFLQGIGGSIGMVIATAATRDLYTGHDAARMMSMVIMVLGLAPVIAPLAGSGILQFSDWRAIFAAMTLIGCAIVLIVMVLLPETRMPELRAKSRPTAAVHWYGKLLFTGNFIPYAGALAFAQGGFFAYIAGSSFVLIKVYGLSPLAYSLIFSLNAIGIGVGTQIGPHLARRLGMRGLVKLCAGIYALLALILLALEVTGIATVIPFCVLMFAIVMMLGGIMPSCNILAMEGQGAIAGTAAALMGALGFAAGALGSFGTGMLQDGTALPLVLIIALCACATAIVAFTTFGPSKRPEAAGHPARHDKAA